MIRTWMIAVAALAASQGTSLAQDAGAGEQVYRRHCFPCHDVGETAKVKLGPPLNGLEGRQRERARRVLGRVRMRLEEAETPYRFAGDFHSMVPERSPLQRVIWRVGRFLRRVRRQRRSG